MESTVKITGLAFGGRGVGRIDGKVVFVPFTAPGDEARVVITSEKKGYSEGVLKELLKPSEARRRPPCGLFGLCGGCSLQHMGYPEQIRWKQTIFEETLKRIGKAVPPAFDPPLPSPREFHYRTRARFHVEGRSFGFYEEGTHRVVDIEDCPILDPLLNETLRKIKALLAGKEPRLFALDLGVSQVDNKAVAAFHLSGGSGLDWEEALGGIDTLKGFEVRLSPLKKPAGRMIASAGDRSLSYKAGDMSLSASIGVFSQVNLFQNENLVKKAVEYSGLKGADKVLDLFSGVGNLTLSLARHAKEATGVESSREAVTLARKNASLNSLGNIRFFSGDALEWLSSGIKTLEKEGLDVVVLDPPRGGEPEVAKILARLRPKKIVYVSCSPPTLARDITLLTGCGYRLTRAGLFDMFPQTYHIESIAGLELVTD